MRFQTNTAAVHTEGFGDTAQFSITSKVEEAAAEIEAGMLDVLTKREVSTTGVFTTSDSRIFTADKLVKVLTTGLSIRRAADLLGLSESTLRGWIKTLKANGLLPA